MNPAVAYVISVERRYFHRMGKGRRVLTAHAVAGARMFQKHEVYAAYARLLTLLKRRGDCRKVRVIAVGALAVVSDPKTLVPSAPVLGYDLGDEEQLDLPF